MWRHQDTGAGTGNIYFSRLTDLVLLNLVTGPGALYEVYIFMQSAVIIPAVVIAVGFLVITFLAGDSVSLL